MNYRRKMNRRQSRKWQWAGLAGVAAMASFNLLADEAAAPASGAKDKEAVEAKDSKEKETKADAGTKEAKETAGAKEKTAEPAEDESATELRNWIDISAGGIVGDGDKRQFLQRHNIRYGPYGGIEDMHFEEKVGKKSFFQLDGRALLDLKDYAIRYELVQPDLGFIRGGFKQYRTWYDTSGGYFPPSGEILTTRDDELGIDRGQVWFETGLTLKDKPQVSLKYNLDYRHGLKASTIWGDSNLTGPGLTLAVPTSLRGIVPSVLAVDEKTHTVQANVKHHAGKTQYELGGSYSFEDNNDKLKVNRRAGEGPPVETYLTHKDKVESDIFNIHSVTETPLNEKLLFTTGYSFTKLDADLSGSRVYGDAYDVGYRPAMAYSQGYVALDGGASSSQHAVSLSLMATPWKNFTIVPSIRIERLDMDSASDYMLTSPSGSAPVSAYSDRGLLDVAGRLEARYSGVTNWVFYTRGDWSAADGDLRERGGNGALLFSPGVDRLTYDQRWIQRYTAGANWYPLRRLNIDFQYYHKISQNSYDNAIDSTPNNSPNVYPAYLRNQDFTTDDVNTRLTWRALNNVTFVSRYDFQYSTIDTRPDLAAGLPQTQSGLVTSHIFGESVTWIPWSRLFTQAGVNYTIDKTETPATQYTPAVANGKNDYLTASFTAGFVLDEKTDLQANYFYYVARDFVGDPAFGQPYGADAQEHGITLTLTRKLTKNLRLTTKYGYYAFQDNASGGLNSYNAHLLYSSLHCRF